MMPCISQGFWSNPLHRRMCGAVDTFTSKVQEWYRKQAETENCQHDPILGGETAPRCFRAVPETYNARARHRTCPPRFGLLDEVRSEGLAHLLQCNAMVSTSLPALACPCRPSLNAGFFGVFGCRFGWPS